MMPPSMYLVSSLLGMVLIPLATAVGGISTVEELTEDQMNVVNFALVQLEGGEGGLCKKKTIKVENFSQQVVSGLLYRFDLALEHNKGNPEECEGPDSGVLERCHMQVWEQKWMTPPKRINWDKINCTRGQPAPNNSSEDTDHPKVARVPLTKSDIVKASPLFPQLRVGLVNQEFVGHGGKLLGGGDHDFVPHGKKEAWRRP